MPWKEYSTAHFPGTKHKKINDMLELRVHVGVRATGVEKMRRKREQKRVMTVCGPTAVYKSYNKVCHRAWPTQYGQMCRMQASSRTSLWIGQKQNSTSSRDGKRRKEKGKKRKLGRILDCSNGWWQHRISASSRCGFRVARPPRAEKERELCTVSTCSSLAALLADHSLSPSLTYLTFVG